MDGKTDEGMKLEMEEMKMNIKTEKYVIEYIRDCKNMAIHQFEKEFIHSTARMEYKHCDVSCDHIFPFGVFQISLFFVFFVHSAAVVYWFSDKSEMEIDIL